MHPFRPQKQQRDNRNAPYQSPVSDFRISLFDS